MHLLPLPPSLLVASTLDRLSRGLFDDTFAGIHQLSWFDWALLVPYFGILGLLSIYGLHRFETIRTYFKYRRNATREPAIRFQQLPRVTIQLPLYNERYVMERLIDEVVKIEYPRELLQIQVLDDSTDDTHQFAEALCERCRRVAARHADGRFGPELPGAAERLEIRLSSRSRLPVRAAGGDSWVPGAAVPLGERPHAVREKAPAGCSARADSFPREIRSHHA